MIDLTAEDELIDPTTSDMSHEVLLPPMKSPPGSPPGQPPSLRAYGQDVGRKSPSKRASSPTLGLHDVADGQTDASSLCDSVDKMEQRLARALKEYRTQAESVLEEHYEIMEQAENRYDHQISLLRAENSKLRQMLGVKKPEDSIAQNVMFQAQQQQIQPGNRKAGVKAARAKSNDDDDKQVVGLRNKGKAGQQQQPGGAWQQFLAWVPNGSALQQPEPWKPLPQQSPGLPGQAQGSSRKGSVGQQNAVHGILPGAVTTNDDDDERSESSGGDSLLSKFEIVETWRPNAKESRKLDQKHSCMSAEDSDRGSFLGENDHDQEFCAVEKPRFILDPDSNVRISWDMGSLFLVVYDMIMIPMMSFDLPENAFLLTMDWTTRLFWTFDMAWSCCTGVVLDDGSVEYNPRFIFRRYFKSWFGLDIFIVGSDWSGLIFQSGGMGFSRLARVSRVARIVRLLRLVRMQEIIVNIMERIQNDKIATLLHILKLLAFLIALGHIIACMWWGIGGGDSGGRSWVQKFKDSMEYSEVDRGLGYLVSIHWSLAQFAGGMDELTPSTAMERFFAVFIFILGFMASLVMLSYLTSTLTQQYIIGGNGARQMATLKKYLNQNKISKRLLKRVCRNAKHAISGDLTPDTVDLLHVVSEPLKIEMHNEMYSPVLSCHPLFHELINTLPHQMRRICHLAMSTLWLASGDILFSKGEEASEPKMCFVMSGNLDYIDRYGTTHAITEKMWLSEAVLWTSWKYMGTLIATNDVKLALLDAITFQETCHKFMKKSRKHGLRLKSYARAFLNELNDSSNKSDLSS